MTLIKRLQAFRQLGISVVCSLAEPDKLLCTERFLFLFSYHLLSNFSERKLVLKLVLKEKKKLVKFSEMKHDIVIPI